MGNNGTMAFQGETKLCRAIVRRPKTTPGVIFRGGGNERRTDWGGRVFPNRLRYATANAARMRR